MDKREALYKFLFEEYDIINPLLTFDGDYLLGEHNLAQTKYDPKKDIMVLNSKLDEKGNNKYLDFYTRKVLFNFDDPRFEGINELKDISDFTLKEIHNFFENYKSLQGIDVEVGEYHSKEEALELLETCRRNYHN